MKTSRAIGSTHSIIDRSISIKGIAGILLSSCIFNGSALAGSNSNGINPNDTKSTSTNNGKHKADTASCENIKGRWLNELGSTLIISELKKDGSLAGQFISPRENGAEQFQVIGWFNNTRAVTDLHFMPALTFSINWGVYGSVSAWSGGCTLKNGVPTLVMIMNLALVNAQYEWDHMITGSDRFTPL